MFGLPDAPRPPDLLRDHRQPRGAVRRPRDCIPDRGVAYSADAHYTHARMCRLLGVRGHAVAADAAGRMDLDALADAARRRQRRDRGRDRGNHRPGRGRPGRRGPGARPHARGPAPRRRGLRRLLHAARRRLGRGGLAAPWRAIAGVDSVVVDPHKHGLQPYGCGAVLFRDPSVGRFYPHDSPYTYFTSDELHLGEISLECSPGRGGRGRAVADAAALPAAAGRAGRSAAAGPPGRAALGRLSRRLGAARPVPAPGAGHRLLLPGRPGPEPVRDRPRERADAGRRHGRPGSTRCSSAPSAWRPDAFARRHPGIEPDRGGARILRSVLMKPEAEGYIRELHARVEQLAGG